MKKGDRIVTLQTIFNGLTEFVVSQPVSKIEIKDEIVLVYVGKYQAYQGWYRKNQLDLFVYEGDDDVQAVEE